MFLLRSKVLHKHHLFLNCASKLECKVIRCFHVTYSVYVRKFAKVHRNIEHSQETQFTVNHESLNDRLEVSSQPTVSPEVEDYFGIESDVNAILVDDLKNSRLHSPKSLSDKKDVSLSEEKNFTTSFGLVRRDSDNKVLYHGQYDASLENETVNKTVLSPNAIVSSELLQDQQNTTEFYSRFKTKLVKKFLKNIERSDLKDSTASDALYFDKSTEHPCSSVAESKHGDQNKVCLDLAANKRTKNNNELFGKQKIKNSEFELNEVGSSFIDNLYFPDILTETSSESEKNGVRLVSSNCVETVDSNLPTSIGLVNGLSPQDSVQRTEHVNFNNVNGNINDLNFIDKTYFPDSNCSIENQNVPVGSRDVGHNTETVFKKSCSDVDQNFLAMQELHNTTSGLRTRRKEQRSNVVNANSVNDAIKDKSNRESMDFYNENPFPKSCIDTDRAMEQNKLHVDSQKSHVASKQFKDSHKVSPVESENSSEPPKIKTAQDFVTEIRTEKQTVPNLALLGKKSAVQETLDSKGFRILKKQVHDLSFFTRDEILQMLTQCVLYSDNEIIVLNKPYNLVIHDSKTTKGPCLSTFLDDLAKILDKQNPNPKLHTVHRLDKETTGCLLLARTDIMAQHLKSLFAQCRIPKTYWILTTNVPNPLEGTIAIPIAEGSIEKKIRMVLHPVLPDDMNYKFRPKYSKKAITHYKVISTSGNAALVEVNPETGITHQIRVHFGFGLSCPILGDHKYSHLTKFAPQKLPSDLLQRLHVRQSKVRHIPMHIHAQKLVIPEYLDGRNLFISAPLPAHMKNNLKSLKFKKPK